MNPKVIVFDLDDTLLDTTSLLIPIAKTAQFFARIRQPLPLLPGARDNLNYLKSKYQLALLTYGNIDSQKQKIKSLGIENDFLRFYFADPLKLENKKMHFEQVVHDFSISPAEFMSVGNRRSTDIREAKQVGGLTCLFHYGEHFGELPTVKEDHPDFEITNHSELVKVCRL